MEKEKRDEINKKLQKRKEELEELDTKYEKLIEKKEKELNLRLDEARTEHIMLKKN